MTASQPGHAAPADAGAPAAADGQPGSPGQPSGHPDTAASVPAQPARAGAPSGSAPSGSAPVGLHPDSTTGSAGAADATPGPPMRRRRVIPGQVSLDRESASGAAESSVVITVLEGPGGVGKTALAVRLCHELAKHFPHGQLYVDLRTFDPSLPPTSVSEALGNLLQSLGVPAKSCRTTWASEWRNTGACCPDVAC